MATLREFKNQFKDSMVVEHPGFSSINVRSHCDCSQCGANLLMVFHFYPELFAKYRGQGNSGFSFHGVEFYRTPGGEIIRASDGKEEPT